MVASVGASYGTEKLDYDERYEMEKLLLGKDTSTSTNTTTSNTTNSGSTNTGTTNTTGGTSGSTNTSTNSGSVNVSETLGSVNNTSNSGSVNTGYNSGSTNTTNTAGSQNVTKNSGSTNTSTTDASVNTVNHSGSVNSTTQGPSTKVSTTQNSGSVNVSQLMLTEEAVNHLTKQMMESTQGLAAVSKGQNMSGAYNTTANTLLTNDLLSRVGGEVAARAAPTRTIIGGSTSTNTITDTGFTTIQNIGSSSSTQNVGGTKTTNNIGESTSTQDIGATSTVNNIGSSSSSQNIGGSTSTQNIGGTKSTQNIGGSTSTQAIGATSNFSAQDITNIIGGSSSTALSTSLVNTLLERESKEVADAHTWGEKDKEESKVESKAGWILCTELHNQKRMPHAFYVYGLSVFNTYPEHAKEGYYLWARPALKHLKAKPFSLLSRIMCKMLNARAEQIAYYCGCKRAKKSALGWFTVKLYWGCWIIGKSLQLIKDNKETSNA